MWAKHSMHLSRWVAIFFCKFKSTIALILVWWFPADVALGISFSSIFSIHFEHTPSNTDDFFFVVLEKNNLCKSLIDGNCANFFLYFQTVPTSRLASLPPAFISDKPYANYYGLALIALPPEEDDKVEAAKSLAQDALNRDLLLNVEYKYELNSQQIHALFS